MTRAAIGLLCGAFFASCAPAPRPVQPASAYGDPPQKPAALPSPSEEKPKVVEPESIAEPADEPPASPPSPPAPQFPRAIAELATFYEALDALRAGNRESSVRVLWLGDSHTAADFMTHPLRQWLSSQVRDGGPGFVRLGLKGYRHGAVRFKMKGKWRKAPILPAQRTRVLDGIFGYGGIRTLPAAGARITASLREPGEGEVLWTLSYRLPPGAQLEVKIGDAAHRLRPDNEEQVAPGDIRISQFRGKTEDSFSVAHVAGDPQIFGAFVERADPGVILDTVGINGARAATPLAWRPEQWVAQVQKRSPELLVLAFGTNEVFDKTAVHRYAPHFEKLVGLARQAVPDLPCWIVGPPDSATSKGTSKERVALVTEVQREVAQTLGCGFTSAYELMGGEGSFHRWMKERPQKARGDKIHLTIEGYRQLGKMISESLLPPEQSAEDQSEGKPEQQAALN